MNDNRGIIPENTISAFDHTLWPALKILSSL